MIKIENIETSGWKAAIKGTRNPFNSWSKSDSSWEDTTFSLGPNDFDLACRLIKAGPEHRKFLRMIHVSMDITMPLYLAKETDTYKVGTVTNSCSTMHKIHTKEFTESDFSCEHLCDDEDVMGAWMSSLHRTIADLNTARELYLETKDKKYWWQMIQLLPSSYNQLRTLDTNYETILTILKQRKGHKLDEWHEFRHIMFEELPYLKEFYTAMTNDTDFN